MVSPREQLQSIFKFLAIRNFHTLRVTTYIDILPQLKLSLGRSRSAVSPNLTLIQPNPHKERKRDTRFFSANVGWCASIFSAKIWFFCACVSHVVLILLISGDSLVLIRVSQSCTRFPVSFDFVQTFWSLQWAKLCFVTILSVLSHAFSFPVLRSFWSASAKVVVLESRMFHMVLFVLQYAKWNSEIFSNLYFRSPRYECVNFLTLAKLRFSIWWWWIRWRKSCGEKKDT